MTSNSNTDRAEVTPTGIVRQRNENGYIIHPHRHDTGAGDRRMGWSFIIAGVLTAVVSLPAGLSGMFWLVPWGLLGWLSIRAGRRKRRRIGGSRRTRRDRDRDDGESRRLESDPIWRYRRYWALLGFGSVAAAIIAGNGLLGEIVAVVALVALVTLATLGWRQRGSQP